METISGKSSASSTRLRLRGVVNTTLQQAGVIDFPMVLLFTPEAVVMGLLTILLPYMVISIANALATLDPRYEEAAASLGAGPIRSFIHVVFPLSAPGVASGALLVFLLTLSAYVTITLLGGPRSKLLVSLVYDSVVAFQWPQAAALAFVLLALALATCGLILAVLRIQRLQLRQLRAHGGELRGDGGEVVLMRVTLAQRLLQLRGEAQRLCVRAAHRAL